MKLGAAQTRAARMIVCLAIAVSAKVLQSPHAPSSLMERLLVTTALERSWSDVKPMLFLGEWCRLYSRRDRWSELDAAVLPYHWDDRAKFTVDSQYLMSLHEELLAELSDILNDHHGVDYSLRYWRILIGPWLGYFTQTLFDRWESIHHAVTTENLSGTVVLTGLTDARVSNDMDDFLWLRLGHGWNHHLCARILMDFTCVPCDLQPADEIYDSTSSGQSIEDVRSGSASRWKAQIISMYSHLAGRLTRPTDYFLIDTCLRSVRDELELQRRLGQVPRLVSAVPPGNVPTSDWCRGWKLGNAASSDFGSFARDLIPEQLPTAYLEGYEALCDRANRLRWPRQPKAIFTSASHFYDDVFKVWCAARTEEGVPLAVGQHGGHVGTAWSFNHDHQLEIADLFLSWGWSEPNEPKVVPLGMLKAPALPDTDNATKSRALLVTGNADLQSYELASALISRQYLDYLEDQFAFVGALSQTVRDALTVRLSVHQCGWEQEQRWRDRLPEVVLDDGLLPIMELVATTRLYIATDNGTTYLESLFLDVPTVIFWDTSVWKIVDSAVPYFEDLARVGIFHDNPESAASHVSSIWDDVRAWWSSSEVTAAATRFSERYCYDPGDVLEEVKRHLVALMRESRR